MSDKKIYIVQLRFYDEAVTLGAHSTLESAKKEIVKTIEGKHTIGGFYSSEWDRLILVRNLNQDCTDDDEEITIYDGGNDD